MIACLLRLDACEECPQKYNKICVASSDTTSCSSEVLALWRIVLDPREVQENPTDEGLDQAFAQVLPERRQMGMSIRQTYIYGYRVHRLRSACAGTARKRRAMQVECFF